MPSRRARYEERAAIPTRPNNTLGGIKISRLLFRICAGVVVKYNTDSILIDLCHPMSKRQQIVAYGLNTILYITSERFKRSGMASCIYGMAEIQQCPNLRPP